MNTKPVLPATKRCGHCGAVLSDPNGKGKKFCDDSHRNKWHLARRKAAMQQFNSQQVDKGETK